MPVFAVAGINWATGSAGQERDAKPLGTPQLPWTPETSVGDGGVAGRAPRLNPFEPARLGVLPPTIIVFAGVDPPRSVGEALAEKLQAAGTPTALRVVPGATHDFFRLGSTVGDARVAQAFAADRLRAAFGARPTVASVR